MAFLTKQDFKECLVCFSMKPIVLVPHENTGIVKSLALRIEDHDFQRNNKELVIDYFCYVTEYTWKLQLYVQQHMTIML